MSGWRSAAAIFLLLATGDHGVAADAPRPAVLLICVDDLRPELKCCGADYIHSPHIDALAARGRLFLKHYVQAPTCGASRYAMLTGRYGPSGNGALFARGRKKQENADSVPKSMPGWFRAQGYTTVSVGKVSHHPGGRGGRNWDDNGRIEMPGAWDRHLLPAGPWRHPRGAMHGLANGEIRGKAGEMDVFQAVAGDDSVYPDGLITDESIRQLKVLCADDQPFFLAVGLIRPHLPFGAPAKYLKPYANVDLPKIPHPGKPTGKTTWHRSGEFMKYNRWGRNPNTDADFALEVRRHYAACVSYADAQVGRLLKALEDSGRADNTIVILWGDHGWHLGEHAIWGKHALFEESLRSPLIIAAPQVRNPGRPTDAVCESIDLFPTLSELLGGHPLDFVHGRSLLPQLRNQHAAGHPAFSYARAQTIRTDRFRLIRHADGHIELYDHHSPNAETQNAAAEHPEVVQRLTAQIETRQKLRVRER